MASPGPSDLKVELVISPPENHGPPDTEILNGTDEDQTVGPRQAGLPHPTQKTQDHSLSWQGPRGGSDPNTGRTRQRAEAQGRQALPRAMPELVTQKGQGRDSVVRQSWVSIWHLLRPDSLGQAGQGC